MKKVLALIGSRKGRSGNTALLASKLMEHLERAFEEEVAGDILAADTWDVRPCLSCDTCFRTGSCVQDSDDGMKAIQEKILACDLVILGSPVFACHVSGDMKTLIDRLSVWLHVMPLIGTFGIPLCTTSNSCAAEVTTYLSRMLLHMGASVPTDVTAYVHRGPVLLRDSATLGAYLEEKAGVIAAAFRTGPGFTALQEQWFRIQNAQYRKMRRLSEAYPGTFSFGEAETWCEYGYDRFSTIQEAANVRR